MKELKLCQSCCKANFFIDRMVQPAYYKPHCDCTELGWYLNREKAIEEWNDYVSKQLIEDNK